MALLSQGPSGLLACAAMAFMLSSCASVTGPSLQPEINGLIVADRIGLAAQRITAREADYGPGNYVLYHLDRAMVLQMDGKYAASARSFEKARMRHEELYTRSLTKEAAAWAVNDNMQPYRSPEYERVLMNVFQMFNYLQIGDLQEALVEARDLDSRFPVAIGHPQNERGPEDNGFARLLSGVLYEAAGSSGGFNDALIAYKQALAVYDAYYDGKYVPRILQEGLLRLGKMFNDEQLDIYRKRFPDAVSGDAGGEGAVVYLFESVGFAPVKVPEIIPVPVDRDFVTKIAFPRFMERIHDTFSSRLVLGRDGGLMSVHTETGVDIGELAAKDLEARRAWIFSKAVIRPALKYLVERAQKKAVEKKYGQVTADVMGVFSNLYNFYTEQADLRSWQSLPAQLRMARVAVVPGTYELSVEDFDASGVLTAREDRGAVDLRAGRTYFFIRRCLR